MLTAKQARALSHKTEQALRSQERNKAIEEVNKILPDILKRIEEEASRTDKASYCIDITSLEYYYISKTTILEDLGYRVESFTDRSVNNISWKYIISWI